MVSVGSIVAKFQLNIDNFTANMKNAENQIKKLEDKFSGYDAIGGKFTDLGSKLTLGLTVPITGAITAATNLASTFEEKLSKVQAISGSTAQEMDALKEKAMEMGAKTKFSASESADAMTYMAMAGWDASQMIDGIAGIMDLAAADGLDLATTSDIVTDALTAFGMKAEESGRFADVLAAASSSANTSVSMLGESFKYVAPVAGAMGYSVEDASLALGIMANSGVKAGQAGTALRAAITRMAKPTDSAAALMDQYNISMTNSDGTMKSLAEVMVTLKENMGDLNEAEQAQAAATIFGQEAMSGMLAIINSSDADFAKLSDAIYNSEGVAQSMAKTMQDNLKGKIEELGGAVETLGIQIGDILIPKITAIVEKVTGWVDKFTQMDTSTQKVVLSIASFVAGIGPAIFVVGKSIKLFGKLQQNIDLMKGAYSKLANSQVVAAAKTKILTAAQKALNLVMNMNPISWVIIGIMSLIAVFVLLWKKCDWFREFWINLWEGMKESAGKLWEWLQEAGKNCVERLVNTWDGIKEWWSGLWTWLKQAPQQLWDWMTNLFSNVWESMKAGWESFKTGLQEMWTGIKDWFGELWEGITGVFSEALGWVTESFSGSFDGIKQIWEGMQQYFTGAWEVIKNIFAGALLILLDLITLDFDQMKSDIANIWENIKNGFKSIWEGISNIFSGNLTAIKEFWSTSWELVKNKAVEIWNAVVQFFTETWNNITTAWNQWLDNVKKWWSDTWQSVQDKAKEIWNGIINFFTTTWTNIGNSITTAWTNFKTTITNKCTEIKNWIVQTWNNIIAWFKELPGKLRQIGSDMFTKMKDGISSTISGVTTAVKNGINSAIKFLTDLPRQAITWGRHMIEGFIQGIKNTIGELLGTVKDVAQSIRDFLGFSIPKKGPLHVYMEWMPHMMEGMRDSLKANQYKLINAAKGVAGSLSDAVNSDVGLAIAGNVAVTSPRSGVSSYSTPTEEESIMKKLLSELKSLNDKTTEYNINIEQVNADDPNDIRKLAEELEAFKENNKTF